MELLGLEEDMAIKKYTKQFNQVLERQLSSKGGTRPKQPQSQGQCGRGGSARRRGRGKMNASCSPGPKPLPSKEDKANGHKSDKGKTSSS